MQVDCIKGLPVSAFARPLASIYAAGPGCGCRWSQHRSQPAPTNRSSLRTALQIASCGEALCFANDVGRCCYGSSRSRLRFGRSGAKEARCEARDRLVKRVACAVARAGTTGRRQYSACTRSGVRLVAVATKALQPGRAKDIAFVRLRESLVDGARWGGKSAIRRSRDDPAAACRSRSVVSVQAGIAPVAA